MRRARPAGPALPENILLFAPQDIILQKYLIEQTVLAPARKRNELQKLQMMVEYTHTPRCLRRFILGYFGDRESPRECGNCSNCNDENELTDITNLAFIQVIQEFLVWILFTVSILSKRSKW